VKSQEVEKLDRGARSGGRRIRAHGSKLLRGRRCRWSGWKRIHRHLKSVRVLVDRARCGIDSNPDYSANEKVADRPAFEFGGDDGIAFLKSRFVAADFDILLAALDLYRAGRSNVPTPERALQCAFSACCWRRCNSDSLRLALYDGSTARQAQSQGAQPRDDDGFHLYPQWMTRRVPLAELPNSARIRGKTIGIGLPADC